MLDQGRCLTVEARRSSSLDSAQSRIGYTGFDFRWPDGTPITTGVSRLCQWGTRLLLGRRFEGDRLLLDIWVLPTGEHEPLPRLPKGWRIHRLMLKREGSRGMIHLFDRTPTDLIFQSGVDEPSVLAWIGFCDLADGEERWLDMVVKPA